MPETNPYKRKLIEGLRQAISSEKGEAPSLEVLDLMSALTGDKRAFKTMMGHLATCCQEVMQLPENKRPSWWLGIYYLSICFNEYINAGSKSLDKAFSFEKSRGRPTGGDAEYQVEVGLTAYQAHQGYIDERGTTRGARKVALIAAIERHRCAQSFAVKQLQHMLKPMFGPDSMIWGEFYLLLFTKAKRPQK